MELTEKQVRKLAEDRIFKCYGDGYCDMEAMINLFVDGYSEATQQIKLSLGGVIDTVCDTGKNMGFGHWCAPCNLKEDCSLYKSKTGL